MIICVVDGCAGVQPMRMKRVGGNSPYEEQGEEYVGKGESVEFALKICETGCDCEERVWCVLLFVVADIEVNDVCYESVQDNRDGLWRWFKSIGGTMNGIDELQSVVECAICIGDIRKWEWNVLWNVLWNLWKSESDYVFSAKSTPDFIIIFLRNIGHRSRVSAKYFWEGLAREVYGVSDIW